MLYKEIQQNAKPLFRAVGCICIFEGNILLLQRVLDKSYPGYWGIPSGKIKDNESPVKAMVRELFEETGILLSGDNLKEINTYHIVNNDMNFLYTLFLTNLKSPPKIKLNNKEHTKYGWFSSGNALQLELIPDLDQCLLEVFPEKQLELFTIYNSTKHLENKLIKILTVNENNKLKKQAKISVSLGSPGSGKSQLFKELILRNPTKQLISDNTWAKANSNLNLFLKKAFEEEEREFFFHFQMESLLIRFLYTFQAPNLSLVDESIYTTLAYSRALYRLNWIKIYEYEIFYRYYSFLLNLLPRPQEIIYLECDNDILKKRLKRRNRKHEGHYTDEYIKALQFAFSEVAIELELNGFKVIKLNSSNTSTKKLVKQYVSIKTD